MELHRLGGENRGAYSAIPEHTRKTAASLDTVLKDWDPKDEIKYAPSSNLGLGESSGYYYSDSQKPEGLIPQAGRFVARLGKPEERGAHRDGIDAAVEEVKNERAFPYTGTMVASDLAWKKSLGQPVTVSELKDSIEKYSTMQTPEETATTEQPFIKGYSLFGKAEKNRRPVLEMLVDDAIKTADTIKQTFTSGYQPIGGDDAVNTQNKKVNSVLDSKKSNVVSSPFSSVAAPIKAARRPSVGSGLRLSIRDTNKNIAPAKNSVSTNPLFSYQTGRTLTHEDFPTADDSLPKKSAMPTPPTKKITQQEQLAKYQQEMRELSQKPSATTATPSYRTVNAETTYL